jgi:hypothetical protein
VIVKLFKKSYLCAEIAGDEAQEAENIGNEWETEDVNCEEIKPQTAIIETVKLDKFC